MDGMVNLRKKRPRSDADSMGAGGQPQVSPENTATLICSGL